MLASKVFANSTESVSFFLSPATFIKASSRSTEGPSTVKSATALTGTRRSSWALICSKTILVPELTIVIFDK